jgi:uncharacterized protein with HEPN domain
VRRDPAVFLRHILLCLERIRTYTADGREAFFADPRTQDAVVRNLEIIGQAVKDLGAKDLAQRISHIPWQQIAGLRNVLAHQYLGVDLRLVWNVVEKDLPALRAAVEAMLADGGGAS